MGGGGLSVFLSAWLQVIILLSMFSTEFSLFRYWNLHFALQEFGFSQLVLIKLWSVFWLMCRLLQGNIQTLHGAKNQNKTVVWNIYYDLLSKFNLSRYILFSVFIAPLHFFIYFLLVVQSSRFVLLTFCSIFVKPLIIIIIIIIIIMIIIVISSNLRLFPS